MIRLNGKELPIKLFPNNETVLIDLIHDSIISGINTLELYYSFDSELFQIMLIKGWMDDLKLETVLYIPYMPYSRMDRSENYSAFSLKYVCNFINSLKFQEVMVLEPHSYMTIALLDNLVIVPMAEPLLEFAIGNISSNGESCEYILFPDDGAQKRYKSLGSGLNTLVADKVRDFKTGEIKGLNIKGAYDLEGKNVIILDDLCSAGGSFYYSALALKKINAGNIYLAVTHCENTIHKGKLLYGDEVTKIYTTNSILTEGHKKIEILDVRIEGEE